MRIGPTLGLVAAVVVALAAGCETAPADPNGGPDGAPQCTVAEMDDVFARYIEPIVADPESQSCAGCHPSAVSLSMWVVGSPCQTVACMLEREVIDLDDPSASRIFGFIDMSDPDDIAVRRETDGFAAWIDYMSACGAEACGDYDDPCADAGSAGSGASTGAGGSGSTGSGSGENMIGSCLESDVLALWASNVQGTVDTACKSCHGSTVSDPKWVDAGKWFIAGDPLATLMNAIGTPNMLNPNNPTLSEIVTKPLHMGSASSSIGTFIGVEHGGGQKLSPSGMNFQEKLDAIAAFLDFYSTCTTGP